MVMTQWVTGCVFCITAAMEVVLRNFAWWRIVTMFVAVARLCVNSCSCPIHGLSSFSPTQSCRIIWWQANRLAPGSSYSMRTVTCRWSCILLTDSISRMLWSWIVIHWRPTVNKLLITFKHNSSLNVTDKVFSFKGKFSCDLCYVKCQCATQSTNLLVARNSYNMAIRFTILTINEFFRNRFNNVFICLS